MLFGTEKRFNAFTCCWNDNARYFIIMHRYFTIYFNISILCTVYFTFYYIMLYFFVMFVNTVFYYDYLFIFVEFRLIIYLIICMIPYFFFLLTLRNIDNIVFKVIQVER
jgi:hypothetical protein